MKSSATSKLLIFLAATLIGWSSTRALAQATDDDEELEFILIGEDQDGLEDQEDFYDEENEDTGIGEQSENYRLIEDDEEDDWVEPASQKEADGEELKRLYVLYREAMESKSLLEADTLAKRVVELSIRVNGLDSMDSARAITNLGIVQHSNQDYESAMLNFTASIGIIERIDNRLSAELINPLRGLAASEAASGQPALARQTYQRAVHISHVNEGPHNQQQVQTLQSIAELHLSMGDFKEANDIQENIFELQARNIDPLSLDILPALQNKAIWQHRLQSYQGERLTWRQIINVIERQHGKESLDLIEPLTNLGKSYLFVSPSQYDYAPDVSSSSGESYLRRANRIAETNPDSNWEIVEDTLLSLGDYYILSGRPNRASKIYEDAWALLSEGNDRDRLRNRWEHMEQVNVLQQVFPPRYYNSERVDNGLPPPENFATGTMSFSFTVAETGRVTDLAIIETEPAELQEFGEVVGRSLRRLLYRPRTNEGKPVATRGVEYIHEFYYRPSDLPSNQQTPVTPAADEPAEQASLLDTGR
jgi:tetratricopeptide (TPR) repeat protein